MSTGARGRWLALAAVVAGILILSQLLLPTATVLWDLAFLAGATFSTIVIAAAAARMRTSAKRIWWCLTGFAALSLLGDVLYLILDRFTDEVPFPGSPDVLYLASYGMAFAGLLLLGRRRLPGNGAAAWIDAAILTVAVAAIVSVAAQSPILADLQVFDSRSVLTLAYPVVDLVVLAALLRLVLVGGRASTSGLLITSSFAVTLGADLLFNVGYGAGGTDLLTRIFQALYLTAYLLLAAAAVSPSARELGQPADGPVDNATGRRAILIIVGVLVTPALMLYVIWPDDRWLERLLGILTVIVILLALMRIRLLLRVVERQAAALSREARTDPLTGLPNRRTLDYEIERAVADARSSGRRLILAMIDMDHFKSFNDDHGHQAGDQLLASSVRAWVGELPDSAFLARYGGEEFALLLHGCTALDATEVLERVRLATPQGCTASIGFAELRPDESAFAALHRADQALYAAKSGGRDRVVAAEPAGG